MDKEIFIQVSRLTRAVFNLLYPIKHVGLFYYEGPITKMTGGVRLRYDKDTNRLLEIAGATTYSFYLHEWGFVGETIECPDDATFLNHILLIKQLIDSRKAS